MCCCSCCAALLTLISPMVVNEAISYLILSLNPKLILFECQVDVLLSDGLCHEVFQPSDTSFSLQVRAPRIWCDIKHCHVLIVVSGFNILNSCPVSFPRCVTASVSASASMTQQLLSGRGPRPRPFRVTNADRSVKKGVMADTLEDLMNKVRMGRKVLKGLMWCSWGWMMITQWLLEVILSQDSIFCVKSSCQCVQ